MYLTTVALAAIPLLFTTVSGDSYPSSSRSQRPYHDPNWGQSIVNNKCGSPVYLWNAGRTDGEATLIKAGGQYTYPLYQTDKADNAGPSLKILPAVDDGSVPNLYSNLPLVQFEYTANASSDPSNLNKVHFDVSYVDAKKASPFLKGGIEVTSPQDKSQTKTCAPGVAICKGVYNNPKDDPQAMLCTAANNDIELTLCSANPGTIVGGGPKGDSSDSSGGNANQPVQASSSSSPPQSSASPASSKAAAAPDAENKLAVNNPAASPTPTPTPPKKDDIVYVYETETAPPTIVTVIEHVKEKRDDHVHQHLHAHKKINKRRQGA